jgi:hypothetical protein
MQSTVGMQPAPLLTATQHAHRPSQPSSQQVCSCFVADEFFRRRPSITDAWSSGSSAKGTLPPRLQCTAAPLLPAGALPGVVQHCSCQPCVLPVHGMPVLTYALHARAIAPTPAPGSDVNQAPATQLATKTPPGKCSTAQQGRRTAQLLPRVPSTPPQNVHHSRHTALPENTLVHDTCGATVARPRGMQQQHHQ